MKLQLRTISVRLCSLISPKSSTSKNWPLRMKPRSTNWSPNWTNLKLQSLPASPRSALSTNKNRPSPSKAKNSPNPLHPKRKSWKRSAKFFKKSKSSRGKTCKCSRKKSLRSTLTSTSSARNGKSTRNPSVMKSSMKNKPLLINALNMVTSKRRLLNFVKNTSKVCTMQSIRNKSLTILVNSGSNCPKTRIEGNFWHRWMTWRAESRCKTLKSKISLKKSGTFKEAPTLLWPI